MCKSQKLRLKSADLYKWLLVSTMLTGLFICRVPFVRAQQPRPYGLTENLGEKLDHFRKSHRAALCRRLRVDEGQTARNTSEKWVTCSVDRDVSFVGYPLLSEVEPEYPFGLTAIFCNRKLVHLAYVVAPDSLESLLPTITKQYGLPSTSLTDSSGLLSSATWNLGTSVLVIEKIPINSEVYEGKFERVTNTFERFAITAHIFYKSNEAQWHSVLTP